MKQTGEALTGSLRDLTGSGKVERDFEWGSNVRKITLAAVSRTGGKGGGRWWSCEEANAIVQLKLRAGLGRTRRKKEAGGGWNPSL